VNSKNQNQVWEYLYRDILNQTRKRTPKYKVGDKVRLSVVKKTFQKGYFPRYTEEVFIVNKLQQTFPITYQIKDLKGEEIKGSFYEAELLKAT
jgi:hypothetical protein